MDIFSFIPILILIFGLASALNKGRTGAPPRTGNWPTPSHPWMRRIENPLPGRFSTERKTPSPSIENPYQFERTFWSEGTTGIEGTSGVEGSSGVEGTSGIEGVSGTEGTPGSEGTVGVEGSNTKSLRQSSERRLIPSRTEDSQYFLDLTEENLIHGMIWAQVLGKPRARIKQYRHNR